MTITFIEKGETYQGVIKSHAHGYVQVQTPQGEFVITEKQIQFPSRATLLKILGETKGEVLVKKEEEKIVYPPVTLSQIRELLKKIDAINHTPSLEKVASLLGTSKEQVRNALKAVGMLYEELFSLPEVVDKTINMKELIKEIELRKLTKRTTEIKSVARSLKVPLMVIRNLLEENKTTYDELLKTIKPKLQDDEFLMEGTVCKASEHLKVRLMQRFPNLTLSELIYEILKRSAKVKRPKRETAFLKKKHGKEAHYFVSFKYGIVLIFSQDYKSLVTTYSTEECAWIPRIEEVSWNSRILK